MGNEPSTEAGRALWLGAGGKKRQWADAIIAIEAEALAASRAETAATQNALSMTDDQLSSVLIALDKARAETAAALKALRHQTLRNHLYSPDGCSACESAKALL